MNWIVKNADWIFSGIGVAILSLIVSMLFKNKANKNKTQNIRSGNNSTNIQGGQDVNITIGGKSDEKRTRD